MAARSGVDVSRVLYVVPYLNDPAVQRRVRMLRLGGVDEVIPVGFRRTPSRVADVDGQPAIDLGRTEDGHFSRRLVTIAAAARAVRKWGEQVGPVDAIMARSLEAVMLARSFRRAYAPTAPLTYESLDIHRLLLGDGLVPRILRGAEGRAMADCSALLTSSPGFVREYFERYFSELPPIEIVENKLLISELDPDVASGVFARRLAVPPPGPPWVIGWFGLLRCRRSLHVLAQLCRDFPDTVRVELRGKPAATVGDEIVEVAAATPGMTYFGPYDRTDLAHLYAGMHFSWTPDYSETGANSDWLLPNRLYESGVFGCVPLALRGVETGSWLAAHGVGVLLDEPVQASVTAYLAELTPEAYAATRASFAAVPPSAFVDTEVDAKALVQRIVSPRNR